MRPPACARAGDQPPIAATPASAPAAFINRRRVLSVISELCFSIWIASRFPDGVPRSTRAAAIIGKYEAGLRGPVQMDPITDGVHGIGKLVRCLYHESVLGRQAHIVFQDAAEIRCELDGSGKAVVGLG